ncbi:MAG: diacylglycerol/lipid kinase family protein [Terriglobia bacterium]
MADARRIAVIVNPRAAGGRTARVWKSLRSQMESRLGPLEAWETRAPGQATELARGALERGCRTVIAVGGDGTISDVVNGFFEDDRPIAAGAALGILPQGSSSDLRRSLGLPLEEEVALEILRRGRIRSIDLMRVRFRTAEGRSGQRYGINVTSFGMGGAVAARFNRLPKWLGGRLSFQLATFSEMLRFRGRRVALRLDDGESQEFTISNIAVGNAQFHGGGMWVCPRAAVDDGQLDLTVFRRFTLWELWRDLDYLYNGKVYDHPKVSFHRAARVTATAEEPTFIEVDGEPVGQLPLEITVLPRALPVYVPPA